MDFVQKFLYICIFGHCFSLAIWESTWRAHYVAKIRSCTLFGISILAGRQHRQTPIHHSQLGESCENNNDGMNKRASVEAGKQNRRHKPAHCRPSTSLSYFTTSLLLHCVCIIIISLNFVYLFYAKIFPWSWSIKF